jgi:sterol 3beta-glucosyltransferase
VHITIIAIGSRGDVQPCVALGLGLRRAGYLVRIATHGIFADLVSRCGLEFAPIEGDPRQTMEGRSGQEWLESGKSLVKFMRSMRGLFTYESLYKTLDDIVEACHGTDAILYTVLGTAAYNVAEMLNVPGLYVLLQPFSRTRENPNFLAPALPLGGSYNWWTYLLSEQLFWQMTRVPVNRWRRESLKLKPLPLSGAFDLLYEKRIPFIYGFSRFVVPRPHDWPDWHHITGYWFLDGLDDWSPPTGLVDFLSSGPKPIYIGFGSMSGRAARHLADLAIEAVTMSKQRAVLLGGWAQAHERDLPDHIYATESAPHEWLFPRMAAVVHHGGAGTTASGLRAGLPSVITPFFGDQPYWGQRVYALGVGPKPILHTKLTAKRLADAITQVVTNQPIQCQAAALGEEIRAEDGVARAVEIVSQYASR